MIFFFGQVVIPISENSSYMRSLFQLTLKIWLVRSVQRTMTISIELLAALIWWKRMFLTIGFDPEHKLHTKCDSKQKEDLVVQFRLRHVDVHQREKIAINWYSCRLRYWEERGDLQHTESKGNRATQSPDNT